MFGKKVKYKKIRQTFVESESKIKVCEVWN